MAFKSANKHPQTRNQPEIKKSFQIQICLSSRFQGKKKNLILPPHHMELFNIKINYFGGQNHRQR
jgi:hypothetical protein